jgi:hypothetical protein
MLAAQHRKFVASHQVLDPGTAGNDASANCSATTANDPAFAKSSRWRRSDIDRNREARRSEYQHCIDRRKRLVLT